MPTSAQENPVYVQSAHIVQASSRLDQWIPVHALPFIPSWAPLTRPNSSCTVELRPLAPTGLSAVSRLSSQILGRTLLLASANDEFCRNDSSTIRARTARFTSQVNRRWREVALEHHSIWLGPVLSWYSTPDWLDIILKRSVPLPLDAVLPPDAPLIAVQLALEHLSRIRNLELTVQRNHVGWLEAQLRHHQTPILERLAISLSVGLHQRKQPNRIRDPNTGFSNYAPMLQHVEIHHCPINLPPKLYNGLRVLVFDMMYSNTVLQLLDNLRNTDRLEELYVTRPPDNDISPSAPLIHPSIDVPVSLPHLKALTISAPTSICATIFRNLTTRDSCSIMLRCRNASNNPDLRDILSRLKNTISNWSCDDLTGRQSLDIGATYAQFILQGPDDGGASNGRLHPYIDLEVSWPTKNLDNLDRLKAIFPEVASTFQACKNSPETLVLHSAPQLSSRIRPLLHDWFRGLDYVQEVEFEGHETFALYLPLLGSPTRYSSAGVANDIILLPNLSDLIIAGVDFTSQRQLWRKLLKTMRFREKEECHILQIDFVDCDGDFDQNIPNRYGVSIKVNGEDLASDYEDDGEDSDYTVQGESD